MAAVRFQAYTCGQVACRRSEVLGGRLLLARGSEPPFQKGRAQALTRPLATTGYPSLPRHFSNSLPWLPGKQNPAHRRTCRGRRGETWLQLPEVLLCQCPRFLESFKYQHSTILSFHQGALFCLQKTNTGIKRSVYDAQT